MSKKVIVDCDNTMGMPFAEIDDGLTLLYLLGRDDIDLMGITNCYANSSLKSVEYWTERFLCEIGRTDIPRFSGTPFCGQNSTDWFKKTWGHHFKDERQSGKSPSDAATFLAEQASKYPGQIHVLALGSMTNLYEAAELDGQFFSNLAEIVLMGGVYGDLFLKERKCVELNLACNPMGAYKVLNNGGCPVVIMNANICLQAPFTVKDMTRISFWPEGRRRMVREWLGVYGGTFYLWDLLPAVYLSYPELFNLKSARIASSLSDLEQGILTTGADGAEVIMPDTILDTPRFMDTLRSAWYVAWQMEKKGFE